MERRDLLKTTGLTLGAVGLAGCSGMPGSEETDTGSGETATESAETDAETDGEMSVGAATAVAAEWNAMRARLWDAVAVGVAGRPGAGASLAQSLFADFENASGEWGAHEQLEQTNAENYEAFEEHLGGLREALSAGDLESAREEASSAESNLLAAQRGRVGGDVADALTLQLFGSRVATAGAVAHAGAVDAAGTIAEETYAAFEASEVYGAVESAAPEASESFEGATEAVVSAGDAETAASEADAAFQAAVDGSYALAPAETAAGAGHLTGLGARAHDSLALGMLGGPGRDYAHASVLTTYRARVDDAGWLYAQGDADAAKRAAQSVFRHFEGANAHDALEEANGDAYEGFEEAGLNPLISAIENGDDGAVNDAVATVHENLVAGVGSLVGGDQPALLESGYFRTRLADAGELYWMGETEAAKAVVQSVFRAFEANRADLHETLEDASESLYETFEEEHLASLPDAIDAGDDDAVATHVAGAQEALAEFATTAAGVPAVCGAETVFVAGRAFDAVGVALLGSNQRGEQITQSAFQHFEAGAGGYHEALEEASAETYEAFEERLGAVGSAASGSGEPMTAATEFNAEAVAGIYAIVGAGGGSFGEAQTAILQGVFGDFEEARVHELLEEADQSAYEGFETDLGATVEAVGGDASLPAAVSTFDDAALRAAFAVVGALDKAPVGEGSESGGESEDPAYSGGPNVVAGVPENADHVVKMQAVAFEPESLTVSQGDTVAFEYAAGEPHCVFAYEDEIPEDAEYWASGGFESQEAAETGWNEEKKGAVQSGQSYVHTFEIKGTHGYYCLPHEAAGMVGEVVVE
jgi:plastocyanin